MPEPRPVALIGELLATQVKVRRAAAILVDAAIRDVEELVKLGLPIWARFIRVRGANKTTIGELNASVMIGGARISPNDIVVLDADGGVCIQRERKEAVLKAAEARLERETRLHENLSQVKRPMICTVCANMWKRIEGDDMKTEEPIHDVAHLAHVELLTPKLEESTRFFVEIMGMVESGRNDDSVYLRGWTITNITPCN